MKHFIQVFGRQIELTEEQAKALQEQYAPPSVKLAEVPARETFLIGPHEFVVLEQFGDSAAVILKKLLHESMEFGKNNNFDGSAVDKACGKFADEIAGIIGAENIEEHAVDLTSDDGLKDYGTIRRKMSLLTADLYRKYVDVLDEHKLSSWQWLATPHSTKRHDNESWVKCVSPSGNLYGDSCNGGSIGVRPFCILKSHIFVSK